MGVSRIVRAKTLILFAVLLLSNFTAVRAQDVQAHRQVKQSSPVAPQSGDIEVADLVREAVFEPEVGPSGNFGIVSPNGKFLVTIIRRGNPDLLINESEILLFHLDQPTSLKPEVVAKFSSSSKYLPITKLQWHGDSELTFIATSNKINPNVELLNLSTRRIRRLSNTATAVIWYNLSGNGKMLITTEEPPPAPLQSNRDCLDRGCRIEASTLQQAEDGSIGAPPPFIVTDLQTAKRREVDGSFKFDPKLMYCFPQLLGDLSPDNRFGLQECVVTLKGYPAWWNDYTAYGDIGGRMKAGHNGFMRYLLLVDLLNGKKRALTAVPTIAGLEHAPPAWTEDGKSLIFPGGLQPLDTVEGAERTARASRLAITSVNVESGDVHLIVPLDPAISRVMSFHWDKRTSTGDIAYAMQGDNRHLFYHLVGGPQRWTATPSTHDMVEPNQHLIVRQSVNSSPVVYWEQSVVYDPNSWLSHKHLSETREIEWTSIDGRKWHAVMFMPDLSRPKNGFPLVIQTHGYTGNTNKFSLSGVSNNFAARALAAKGILAVQVYENVPVTGGTSEFDAALAGYESLIDYLSKAALIDQSRLGIQGWSRTGPYVGYMLTKSRYHFAAAALTETGDFGWWYYILNGAFSGETAFGAPPFGEGLDTWRKYSPTFNAEKATAPLLMWEAHSPAALWDWYTLYKRLGMPVEYWVFPEGAHEVVRVPERMRAGNLLVDWYRFWLQGYERPDPQDPDQYKRWEHLRELKDIGGQTIVQPETSTSKPN